VPVKLLSCKDSTDKKDMRAQDPGKLPTSRLLLRSSTLHTAHRSTAGTAGNVNGAACRKAMQHHVEQWRLLGAMWHVVTAQEDCALLLCWFVCKR
jgi:hypothetical protein